MVEGLGFKIEEGLCRDCLGFKEWGGVIEGMRNVEGKRRLVERKNH